MSDNLTFDEPLKGLGLLIPTLYYVLSDDVSEGEVCYIKANPTRPDCIFVNPLDFEIKQVVSEFRLLVPTSIHQT